MGCGEATRPANAPTSRVPRAKPWIWKLPSSSVAAARRNAGELEMTLGVGPGALRVAGALLLDDLDYVDEHVVFRSAARTEHLPRDRAGDAHPQHEALLDLAWSELEQERLARGTSGCLRAELHLAGEQPVDLEAAALVGRENLVVAR